VDVIAETAKGAAKRPGRIIIGHEARENEHRMAVAPRCRPAEQRGRRHEHAEVAGGSREVAQKEPEVGRRVFTSGRHLA
jgi:hypothetical protein